MVVLAPSPSQTVPKAHAVVLEEGSAGRWATYHLAQPRPLWRWAKGSLTGLELPRRHAEDQDSRLRAGSLLGHEIRTWDRMREMLLVVPHEPATSGQPGETLPLRTPALGKVLLVEVVAHKPHGSHMCVRNNEIKTWLKMLIRSKMQKHWQPYPEGWGGEELCPVREAGPRGEWTQ